MSIRADFGKQFTKCFLCGTMAIHTWPPLLETHEIARGPHRKEALENRCALLRTCQRCHEQYLDSMPIVTQLAIKAMNDGAYLDIEKTNLLRDRAPGAITDEEVAAEIDRLSAAMRVAGSEYPFPRHRF